MNDRELLELAAKAAGYQFVRWHVPQQQRTVLSAVWGGEYAEVSKPEAPLGSCFWNPLNNDTDSLRLAVKLGMNVDIGERFTEASVIRADTRVGADERHNGDPLAATRRAIVRAAAEIGRAMP